MSKNVLTFLIVVIGFALGLMGRMVWDKIIKLEATESVSYKSRYTLLSSSEKAQLADCLLIETYLQAKIDSQAFNNCFIKIAQK